MGYQTYFNGQFDITPALKPEDRKFLVKFSQTRRMARNVDVKYGTEGEFYVNGKGFFGQDNDPSIKDYNRPPMGQPGRWCQWTPNKDGTALVWDEEEKFYEYVPWIKYLINRILKPRGYTVNGEVSWDGEELNDRGIIVVKKNKVYVMEFTAHFGKMRPV